MVLKAAQQPPQALTLYEMEASAACRWVREALTGLHLDVDIRPCPIGGSRYAVKAAKISATPTVPVLVDPNADLVLAQPAAIVSHLFQRYGQMAVPLLYRPGLTRPLQGGLARVLRAGRGSRARPSRRPKGSLHLWSFESSPYSRLVRERLSELELPYTLHNLGKEHWDELGPAARRLRPGAYVPTEGGKRHAFWLKHQRVQVPYLEDPNEDVALFESAPIIAHLESTYAVDAS